MISIIPFYTSLLRHFNCINLISCPSFKPFQLCNSLVKPFVVHSPYFFPIKTEFFISKIKLGFRASFLSLPFYFIVFNPMILILKKKMMMKILTYLFTIWLFILKIFSFFIKKYSRCIAMKTQINMCHQIPNP